MDRKQFAAKLAHYVPEGAAGLVTDWLYQSNATLRISQSRTTKLGDYRPPFQGKGHRISVNGDLNPYAFLITLIHEIAHMHAWIDFRNTIKPHGKEWKAAYQKLMHPFLINDTFPQDIQRALADYMNNPAASSGVHAPLLKVLRTYDNKKEVFYLEQLPLNTVFSLNNNQVFIKGNKQRTRYRCRELQSNRIYLINGLAEVKPQSV